MRTFRLLLFIALLLGYSPVFAETADGHNAHNSLDWSGLYLGFTPCADCKGIKTTLALNKNHTYLLLTQFVGKSEREIVEKGKFAWDSETNTIVLTPRKGDNTRQYLVSENSLIELDNHGHRIIGDAADRYVLRRTEVTQPPSESHSAH
jgi:copper homeostasis protein (lipoprotein)